MTIATIETTHAPSLADRIEYAKTLAASGLIPRIYQQQPANVLVAAEYGQALGIAPIVALSEINVINGTPSLSASLMASLARRAGHKVRSTATAEQATCTIIRADDPGFEHTVTWDVARAKSNGLWGKGHWAKDPAVMLEWRAISACVRKACPEVLAGIKYTPEEVVEFSADVPQPSRPRPDRPAAAPSPTASLADVIAADSRDWRAEADQLTTAEDLRDLWHLAPADARAYIEQRVRELPAADEPVDAELVDPETGEVA